MSASNVIEVERHGRSLFVAYVRLCGNRVERVGYTDCVHAAATYDERTERLVRDFIKQAIAQEWADLNAAAFHAQASREVTL